jgi:hypothetical protein
MTIPTPVEARVMDFLAQNFGGFRGEKNGPEWALGSSEWGVEGMT